MCPFFCPRGVNRSFELENHTRRDKFLGSDGRPCGSLARGVLRRSHIVANRDRFIGKETSRRSEQGDDVSMVDFRWTEYSGGRVVADSGPAFYHLQIKNHEVERVARVANVKRPSSESFGAWTGLAPASSSVSTRGSSEGEDCGAGARITSNRVQRPLFLPDGCYALRRAASIARLLRHPAHSQFQPCPSSTTAGRSLDLERTGDFLNRTLEQRENRAVGALDQPES